MKKMGEVLGECWDGFENHLHGKNMGLGEEFRKVGVSDFKNIYVMCELIYNCFYYV